MSKAFTVSRGEGTLRYMTHSRHMDFLRQGFGVLIALGSAWVTFSVTSVAADDTVPPVLSELPKKEAPPTLPPGLPPPEIVEVPEFGNFPSAAARRRTYVGALFGLIGPQSDSLNSRVGFGIQAGHWFQTEWSIGAYFTTSSGSHFVGGTLDGTTRVTSVGAELLLPLRDPRFYVGLRLGIGDVRSEIPALPTTLTPVDVYLTAGPVVVMEHRFSGDFSAGAVADYLRYFGSGGFGSFNILGFFRYWFNPWPSKAAVARPTTPAAASQPTPTSTTTPVPARPAKPPSAKPPAKKTPTRR